MKRPYIPQGIDQQGRITPSRGDCQSNIDSGQVNLMRGLAAAPERKYTLEELRNIPWIERGDMQQMQNVAWGRPGCTPAPAEACTELGAEPTGRPRMGLMHGWERTAIGFSKRPWGLFWVAVCAAVVGYFVKVM